MIEKFNEGKIISFEKDDNQYILIKSNDNYYFSNPDDNRDFYPIQTIFDDFANEMIYKYKIDCRNLNHLNLSIPYIKVQ